MTRDDHRSVQDGGHPDAFRGPWKTIDDVEYATLEWGQTGSITAVYWRPSAMCHRLSMNRCTMMQLTGHAERHDSNQRVSGIPGAIQLDVRISSMFTCSLESLPFNNACNIDSLLA